MVRILTITMGLWLMITSVQAADDSPIDAPHGLQGVLDGLPESTLKKLRRGPDFFIENAAGIILGYGIGTKIGPEGLARYIAARRATVRAREMRKFLIGDLNNDLALSESEVALQVASASANRRGRLLLDFRAADLDRNGVVSFEEIRSYSQSRALNALGPVAEADVNALLDFDANDDGFVSLEEVAKAAHAFML